VKPLTGQRYVREVTSPYTIYQAPTASRFCLWRQHINISTFRYWVTEIKRLIDCSCIIAGLLMNQGERPMKQRSFPSSEKLAATSALTAASEEFAEMNRCVRAHRVNCYCYTSVLVG